MQSTLVAIREKKAFIDPGPWPGEAVRMAGMLIWSRLAQDAAAAASAAVIDLFTA